MSEKKGQFNHTKRIKTSHLNSVYQLTTQLPRIKKQNSDSNSDWALSLDSLNNFDFNAEFSPILHNFI